MMWIEVLPASEGDDAGFTPQCTQMQFGEGLVVERWRSKCTIVFSAIASEFS